METTVDLVSDFPQEEMAMGTKFLEASYPVGDGVLSPGWRVRSVKLIIHAT